MHAQVLVEATYNGLTEEMSEILMGSTANLGPIQEFIRETRKINQYRRLIEDTNQIELDQSAAVADQYRKYPYPTWRKLVEGKKSILEYLDGYPITYEKSATLLQRRRMFQLPVAELGVTHLNLVEQSPPPLSMRLT